jgi:hypothetical protein
MWRLTKGSPNYYKFIYKNGLVNKFLVGLTFSIAERIIKNGTSKFLPLKVIN